MLTSITVENFRGIERLHVEGLGRVNLIIGRNDSGKTALMEAMELAALPDDTGWILVARQQGRGVDAKPVEFDDFWLPVFRQMNAQRGFQIESTDFITGHTRLTVKRTDSPTSTATVDLGAPLGLVRAWTLECKIVGHQPVSRLIQLNNQGLQIPPQATTRLDGRLWISSSPQLDASEVKAFSKLKQRGRDGAVTELLRLINNRISGIEILAPGGDRAGIYIRLENEGLVSLYMMGEGMKRCFEFAISLAANMDSTPLFIDELENGLHHSIMESLWAWIAQATRERNIQLFATTHSEECVQAASRVFKGQDDDGLRVIRLDKQEHETKAVVYDRDLVEAAERMGVEIRG